jgi:VWFA-related protein
VAAILDDDERRKVSRDLTLIGALGLVLGATLFASPAAAQDAQAPVFRSGVELLEVDVNVVDGNGGPIGDLRTPEFAVAVDGKSRTVVSSEFVRDDSSTDARAASFKEDPYVATNTDRPRGRLIIVVVDQNNITTGRARDLIFSLRKFIEQLPAADRVALVAIPSPGPAVEFTANRQRIYQVLNAVRGTEDVTVDRYDVGDAEAIAMNTGGDQLTIRALIDRECASATDETCTSALELEASRIVQRIRTRANESYYSLNALFTNLREAEGTKTMVLLSQGFILDDVQGKTSQLAQAAAEARVNLNVVLLDDFPGDASSSRRSKTMREDRDLRQEGLSALAGKSRGALFQVTSSPEIAFDRLTKEMSGHYLLGVEPTQKDQDGKTHQIRVQVKRSGATVRARRQFRFTSRVADTRAREEQVASLLRSPAAATDLPMRLASYVFQDPESYKEKLLVAAEVDPSLTGTADLMFAFVLFDADGKPVTNGRERKIYNVSGGAPVEYNFALTVAPGTYTLRFGGIDSAGKRGSLEHEVRVWQTALPTITVGDLMIGRVDPGTRGGALQPVVNTRVDNGQVAIYTEFYSGRAELLDGVVVMMELADSEEGPALLRAPAAIMPRVEGAGRQAAVVMAVTALPPGKYYARAVVSAAGQVVGKTTRPFDIVK